VVYVIPRLDRGIFFLLKKVFRLPGGGSWFSIDASVERKDAAGADFFVGGACPRRLPPRPGSPHFVLTPWQTLPSRPPQKIHLLAHPFLTKALPNSHDVEIK